MIDSLVATFVTLFVVIDPLGVAPLFVAITPRASPGERRRLARRGVLIAAGILVGFAWLGESLLAALGVSLPAFRIAGGVLLLLLAVDMVMVRQSGLRATTPSEEKESALREDISVFPLAIPWIAGPGAITTVVLLAGAARSDGRAMAGLFAVLAAVLLVTWICLLVADRLVRLLGQTGINVVSRVAGILLAALAVQFVIDGVQAVR